MKRYICIHGHFYQPPRENPWLESIERQDSAAPFHDWNERIGSECYRPNTRARRLDPEGWLEAITNNYARMSFNFGPTLLSWIEDHAPGVYERILEADAESIERFGGHGSAMAQPYNHMILPLANERDRRTQVIWGIEDFRRRFGRDPEGMWLPETAADTPSLETLAEHGVAFTVLAPNQCARVRALGEERWQDASGSVDPSRPYLVRLPSGRAITVFYYDSPVSHAVAFEKLLESGERFAARLLSGFDERREHTQLVHIATDGETYGHHQRFGEMALAYALERIERSEGVELINYARFLDLHPPEMETEIAEGSSWSCAHGVERWRSDCGCRIGAGEGWTQAWRAPLRDTLDWLRDALGPLYEEHAEGLLTDPWAARDAYIGVVLDRSGGSLDRYFADHAGGRLDRAGRVRALRLLEMQRHAMLMYTSCGWFFDEISGIEAVQVLRYAGRAVQLAKETTGVDLLDDFLERLAGAPSNIPRFGDGRRVFDELVRPSFLSLRGVAAHYAIDLLFEDHGPEAGIYCYDIARRGTRHADIATTALRTGVAAITSRVTLEREPFCFASVYLDDHVVHAGVRPLGDDGDEEAFDATARDIIAHFERGDVADLIRSMDRAFGDSTYSLRSLFRDEQHRVINRITRGRVEGVQEAIRRAYESNASLMRFLRTLDVEMPKPMATAASQVLEADIIDCVSTDRIDTDQLADLFDEAARVGADLDEDRIGEAFQRALRRLAHELRSGGAAVDLVSHVLELLPVMDRAPFRIERSELQIAACVLRDEARPGLTQAARGGDDTARAWLELFDRMAERLHVRLDARRPQAPGDAGAV